jgi:hypothetical protein
MIVPFLSILIWTILIHVYFALVLQSLAKKLKYKKSGLAWIPIANGFLLPILAKKNWKYGFLLMIPWLMLGIAVIYFIIGLPKYGLGLGALIFIIAMLYFLAILETAIATFFLWPIFKLRKYPSWLSLYFILVLLLPAVKIGFRIIGNTSFELIFSGIYIILFIGCFVLLSIVAWNDIK